MDQERRSFVGTMIAPTLNFSGSGNYTALYINPTETAIGTSQNYLINAAVGGASKFVVTDGGTVGIGTANPQAALDVEGSAHVDDTSGGFVNAFSVMNSSETEIVRIGQYSNAGIVKSKVGALKLAGGSGTNAITLEGPLNTTLATINTQGGVSGSMGVGGFYTGYGAFWVVGSNTGLPVAVLAVPSGQTANILQWVTSSNSAGLGTIAGVINSNGSVGIGTTSPLSSLSVAGNLALGTYGGGASTAAAPSNGLIVSGSVGIGTTSPITALDVNGVVNFTTTTTNLQTLMQSESSAGSTGTFTLAANSNNIRGFQELYAESGIQYGILTGRYSGMSLYGGNGTTASMTLAISGNVGIGTTSPQSKLHIQSGEVQVGSSGASCATANQGAIRYNAGILYYCDNSNIWETLDSSGTVDTGDYYIASGTAAPTLGQGMFGGSLTLGGVLAGYGSTADVTLENRTNTPALEVLGNSTNIYMPGSVGIGTSSPTASLQVASLTTSGTNGYGLSVAAPTGATNNYAAIFNGDIQVNNILFNGDNAYNIGSTSQYVKNIYMGGVLEVSNISPGRSSSSVTIDGASTITLQTNNANTNVFQGGYDQDTIIQPYSSSYHI